MSPCSQVSEEIAKRPRTTQRSHTIVSIYFASSCLEVALTVRRDLSSTFAGAVLKIVYGIEAADEHDEYIAAVEAALEGPAQGLVPGKFLVEFLPFLRHIPTWFPGASSQRLFKKWQAAGERLKSLPYEYVKAHLVSDGAA